jgi:hypothetical protein
MSTSYTVPQALVFQQLEAAPQAISTAQRACIIGPRHNLVRYDRPDEKESGNLGEYNKDIDSAHDWPNRADGDEVIQDSARVFIDDALLNYFSKTDGAQATANDSALRANVLGDATGKNVVRLGGTVLTGDNRTVDLPCDVQVGDAVRVAASGSSDEVYTRVRALLPERIPAVIDSAEVVADVVYLEAKVPTLTGNTTVVDGITYTVTPTSTDIHNSSDADAYKAFGDTTGSWRGSPGAELTIQRSEAVAATHAEITLGYTGMAYTGAVEVYGSNDGTTWGTALATVSRMPWSVSQKYIVPLFEATFVPNTVAYTYYKFVFPNTGSNGVQVIDINLVWYASTAPTATVSGTYTGIQDTTYIAQVAKTGDLEDALNLPVIMVKTTTGYDASGPHSVADGALVAIGHHGVTIEIEGGMLYEGTEFRVDVAAEKAGEIKTVVLHDKLPDAFLELDESDDAIDLNIAFFIKKNIEVSRNKVDDAPNVNFVTSDTQITVNAGITGTDSRVDNGLEMLAVEGGTVYVQYTTVDATGAGYVGMINGVTSLSGPTVLSSQVSTLLGTVDPENPIGYGVYKALTNVSGNDVMYVQTRGSTLQDYLEALALLSQRNDVYMLVPMTFDREVQDAVAAHVNAMSGPETGRWRIAFVCRPAVESRGIVGIDSLVSATVENAGSFADVNIATDGVNLYDAGIRPTDVVRFGYADDGFGGVTYANGIVDAVISPSRLRIRGNAAYNIVAASKIEIWRSYTPGEVASETAMDATSFSSRRVVAVWPDYPEVAGTPVPGYYLAAAIAGLKSSVLPQQGLTTVEVAGFDGMSRTTRKFDHAQLNAMAAAGMFIVTQSPTGTIYVRHALTTDPRDINTAELMRTTNLDSISYVMLSRLASFQGRYNITPQLLEVIRLNVVHAVETLMLATRSDMIGPQILGVNAEITAVNHPTFRDRIMVTLKPELPYPNNNTEMYIVV